CICRGSAARRRRSPPRSTADRTSACSPRIATAGGSTKSAGNKLGPGAGLSLEAIILLAMDEDRALVDRARLGDEDAFGDLVRKDQHRIRNSPPAPGPGP